MKRQILILVLIILGVIRQSNQFKKSKSQSKNKHKKYLIKKQSKILKNKKENGDDQKQSGFSDAEIKEFQKVYTFKGYFRKVKDGQSEDALTLKEFTLNQYGIYVNEVGSSTLDGLIDMIRLDELIDQKQVQNLKNQVPVFDDQIREIQMVQVGSKEESSQFPCFIIEDSGNDFEEWQICNQMVDQDNTDLTVAKGLIKFRSQIINKVIQNLEFKNSIKFTSSLLVSDDDAMGSQDGFEGWSYEKPELWTGKCADSSSLQSPIDIISHEVVATTSQIQVITHYHGDQDTIAVRGTNDYFLIGDFGWVIYQNEIEKENKYYCAWRIEFKYSSEHSIDGSEQQLELLVYHKQSNIQFTSSSTESGCSPINNKILDDFKQLSSGLEERDLLLEHTNLVVSFLANPSATVTKETQGVFWQGLEMVDFAESSQPKDMKKFSNKVLVNANPKAKAYMDTIADLEGLVDDGLTQKFLHSFYYYSGSLSQPGCHDDIKRVVMYSPIDVAQSTYDSIQQKVLNGFNVKNNSRKPRNAGTQTMKGYQVFKHVDNSDKAKCPASEIIKKYEDPAFVSKLSPSEKQSLEQLLAQAKESRNRYSSILKNFEKVTHQETTETNETQEINFNHEVNIKSVVKHVHKIPKKLLKKLFRKDKVVAGEKTTLGQPGQQQLNVVLLGNSVKEYTLNAQKQPKQVQDIINNSDNNNIKLKKPNNVINQINLDAQAQEDLASYLLSPVTPATAPSKAKKNK